MVGEVALAFDLYAIFDNTFFFLTFVVSVAGLLGLFSQSFIFAIYSAFITWVSVTMQTDYEFFVNLLMVVMVITLIFMSFQIYQKTSADNAGVGA